MYTDRHYRVLLYLGLSIDFKMWLHFIVVLILALFLFGISQNNEDRLKQFYEIITKSDKTLRR